MTKQQTETLRRLDQALALASARIEARLAYARALATASARVESLIKRLTETD